MKELIAPCGVNCALCMGYQREKNKCPGCNSKDKGKPSYCEGCIIANCPTIKSSEVKFCYICDKFPCQRLKRLDQRYHRRYHVDLINNLKDIQEKGIDEFVNNESKRWQCSNCKELVCMHRDFCFKCQTPYRSEHEILLNKAFNACVWAKIKKVLDAGSGRTSLNILTNAFPNLIIDAIVFPNDQRKIKSIRDKVALDNYHLIEMDICKETIDKEYDLILAHLLLGEALTWGNTFKSLLTSLFSIRSKYYVIYDFLEDSHVDYKMLEKYIKDNNYEIIFKKTIPKREPQVFKDFTGKNYICYVIKKKDDEHSRKEKNT